MNQNDIFRLLLIVLLSANRQLETLNEQEDQPTAAAASGTAVSPPRFNYTGLNDLLILSLFLKLFDHTRELCPDREEAPRHTTF
ncbi:MAG: hypothetical protein LBH24_03015 [Clostridiales bacterium]|jgi:hypothetical protein|nr:hypothetical protein [Clostridiales bacterium]